MIQQLYKNLLLFDQIEVLNVSCEDKEKLLLNISLKEVLIVNVVNETIVIDNEMDKVSKY